MRLSTAAAPAVAVCLLLVMLAAAGGAAAAAADAKPQPQAQAANGAAAALAQPQPQSQAHTLPAVSPSPSKTASASRASQAAASIRDLTSSKLDSNSLSQPPPARVLAVSCPTGADVAPLNPGVDLAEVAKTPNKTYVLQAGTYFINSTITLDAAGTVTCYQGNDTAARDTVRILVGAIGTDNNAILVAGGAGLGLHNLLLDGQGGAGGINAGFESSLEVTSVTMQRFTADGAGGAVALISVTATITRTVFIENTARQGGALYAAAGAATLDQVTFEGNSASEAGGAMFLDDEAKVILQGGSRFSANSARQTGGGIFLRGGDTLRPSLIVNGRLCATANSAGSGGGFAFVRAGTLLFSQGADINLGLNAPDTVLLNEPLAAASAVKCGANSPTWAADAITDVRFSITGPACACNTAFVGSTDATQTCDGCNGIAWNPARCACGECDTLGEGCCRSDGTISPQGTVCRHSAGPCDIEEKCTANGTCPEDSFAVAGTLCRGPRGACERPSVCSGKDPLCAKNYAVNGKPCAFSKSDVKDVFWPIGLQSTLAADADSKAHASNLDGDKALPMRYRYDSDRGSDDEMRREDSNDYYRRHSSADKTYGHRDSSWPECFGFCFAGRCKLEQKRPGCCYPESHGIYAVSQQTAAVAVASDVYKQHGSVPDLVCWRGENDTPQIVPGQA